ncbi:MAG: hypothetical protein RL291_92 [Pseudomonadota bacterium]|jgi:hypothetical protein
MLSTDLPFFLAIGAFGWGLSLITYRWIASRYQWPMGHWHKTRPALPILIGLIAMAVSGVYAWQKIAAGYEPGFRNADTAIITGWAIVVLGFVAGIFWTGLLRVASQISLFLAPAATALLFVAWFAGTDALRYQTVRQELREEMRTLRDQLGLQQPRVRPDGTLEIPRR